MSTDAYAEDVLGADVVHDDRPEESVESKERPRFQKRRPFSKNPQIGLDLVTLSEKLILPVEQFPKYNFVGKLLGPKGMNLKRMQTDCKVRMSIMGRGSSKERNKEDELIQTGDPQYEHLKEPLHIIISARGNKIEAHRRLAAACREIHKFMGPVNEDIFLKPPEQHNAEFISNGREATLPMAAGPKIVFGVPPPGAIILNDNPAFAQAARLQRSEERSPPPRESYAYRGYSDSSSRGSSSRHAEKRGAPNSSSAFPLKRYKQESYAKSEYTSR